MIIQSNENAYMFVFSNIGPTLKGRQPKSETSAQRAHAAKVTHQRRRRQSIKSLQLHKQAVDRFPLLGKSERPRQDDDDANDIATSLILANAQHIDPLYMCSKGGDTSTFNRCVEYYTFNFINNNGPWFAIFDIADYYGRLGWALLEQDLYCHVFIALTLLSMPNGAQREQVWRHLGITLGQLRRTIAEKPFLDLRNDQQGCLIVTVMSLCLCADLLGYHEEAEMHRNMMGNLLKSRGGIENLGYDNMVTATIRKWDFTHHNGSENSTYKTNHLCDRTIYSSPPNYPPQQELKLPEGFESLLRVRQLPTDLVNHLCRLHAAQNSKSELLRLMNQRVRRYSGLWQAFSSLSTAGPDFNKFLCLALALYVRYEFSSSVDRVNHMVNVTWRRTLLTEQISLLSIQTKSAIERQCWMWMWMVVVDSWGKRDAAKPLEPEGLQLLVQFRDQFPEVSNWCDLEQCLSKFFWSSRFQNVCRSYWDIKI